MLSLTQTNSQIFQHIAVIPGSLIASGTNTFIINPPNWEIVKSTKIFFPINFIIENNQPDPLTSCLFRINTNPINHPFNTLTFPTINTIVYCLDNVVNHFHARPLINDLDFNFTIATTNLRDIRIFIHYSII